MLDTLVAEHRVMEDLVRRIAEATDEERMPLLTQFGKVLHGHIRTEERQLFQQIQAALDEAQLAELGKKIDAKVQAACPLTDRLPWADE